jgi:hypothetical protein
MTEPASLEQRVYDAVSEAARSWDGGLASLTVAQVSAIVLREIDAERAAREQAEAAWKREALAHQQAERERDEAIAALERYGDPTGRLARLVEAEARCKELERELGEAVATNKLATEYNVGATGQRDVAEQRAHNAEARCKRLADAIEQWLAVRGGINADTPSDGSVRAIRDAEDALRAALKEEP